ncbi:MAG: hypothetical protein ABF649_00605 [Bacillus sp. (in: firmicutes)]
MSFIFEKHYTEKFEVTLVWKNFMSYKAFSSVRKDKPKCELCNSSFNESHTVHLAFVKGKANKLICTNCADKAVAGGAEERVREKFV